MALQRMILVPPEMWETRSQAAPPPVKAILNTKDHSYNKWMKVRLLQDSFLKSEKQKREPIPIPIVETKVTHPSFKTKPKRERITGSLPRFKTEILDSESETDSLPIHSEYINNVLKRNVSHDRTFGVYQDETDGSFKIGRSGFKFNNKHVFVDGRKYKATQGLWELLTETNPDRNSVTMQDRQAYKQILIQSSAHRVRYSPSGKIKASKSLKYRRFISPLFSNTKEVPWESLQ
jgi:hypothetical protein